MVKYQMPLRKKYVKIIKKSFFCFIELWKNAIFRTNIQVFKSKIDYWKIAKERERDCT